MDWRVALILITAALIALAFAALAIVIARRARRIAELEASVELWRGRFRESRDQLARVLDLEAAREMTDEEAYRELLAAIDRWSAVHPTGAREPDD